MGSNFENTRATLELLGKTKEAARPPLPSSPMWKTIGKLGLLGMGFATGGAVAAQGLDAATEKYKAKRNFKRMLKSHPDLKKHRGSIKPYFRALMHFSPHVAGDPLAAGSFVKRMHDFKDAGFPLQDVETLSRIQGSRGPRGVGDAIRGATGKGVGLSKKL